MLYFSIRLINSKLHYKCIASVFILAAGKEGLPTPGLGIGVGASISARRQEKLGISEGAEGGCIEGEGDKRGSMPFRVELDLSTHAA